jgi:hypothetical protein
MQALEAAEQPTAPPVASAAPVAAAPRPEARPEVLRSERPSAVTTAAVPSAAVLDPIAPISGAPASMSEPISPSSVPPLVPVPRTGARPEIRPSRPELLESRPAARAPSEPRGKASEPRIEYPRAVEGRPALTPAPREAPAAVATALPEPAPRRSNMWIVFVLVIAILGVIAVGVWKFVLEKKAAPAPVTEAPVSTNSPSEALVVPVAPVEPSSAKLSLVKGQPASVKMPVAGALQSVIEDGTVVKEGDELARLAGDKALVQSIAEAKGDLEKRYPFDIARLKKQLEAAPNNRAAQQKLAQREARVAQRTKDLAGYEAELAKLVITAPAAGKVAVVAKVGARLPVEAEVATIEQASYLSGAATMNEKVEKAAGETITVKVKGATATAQCTLETVQDDKISFRCPVADGFADGAEVLVEAK